MSFKLKYKPKEGEGIELDFEQVEQTSLGLLLVGEDKVSGDTYRFIWLSDDPALTIPPE